MNRRMRGGGVLRWEGALGRNNRQKGREDGEKKKLPPYTLKAIFSSRF